MTEIKFNYRTEDALVKIADALDRMARCQEKAQELVTSSADLQRVIQAQIEAELGREEG